MQSPILHGPALAAPTLPRAVSATYLEAAIARCKLPIRVSTGKDIHGYFIAVQDARILTVEPRDIASLWNAGWPHLTGDPRDTKSAYLRLCRFLSSSAGVLE